MRAPKKSGCIGCCNALLSLSHPPMLRQAVIGAARREVQGFYFNKPLPADQFAQLLNGMSSA